MNDQKQDDVPEQVLWDLPWELRHGDFMTIFGDVVARDLDESCAEKLLELKELYDVVAQELPEEENPVDYLMRLHTYRLEAEHDFVSK